MKKTRVIIIHGNQPINGKIDPEYADRCYRASKLIYLGSRKKYTEYIILTGGETVKGQISEAKSAQQTLQNYLWKLNVHAQVLLEENSKTTGENIAFSEELLQGLGIIPDIVVCIGRKSQMNKVRILVKRIWKYGTPEFKFIHGIDNSSRLHKCIDAYIMPFINYIDPRERFFLAWFKRIFRNG